MPYATLLLPAYLFLLAFQRLGIPFLGHRIALADIVLALAVVLRAASPMGRAEVARAPLLLRRLPMFLSPFILAGLVSALVSPDPGGGARALLPYVYALVLTGALGPSIAHRAPKVDRSLVAGGVAMLGVMAFAGLFPGAFPSDWKTLAFDRGYYAIFDKYRFFLEGSTQLAVLALVSFALVVLARIDAHSTPPVVEILLPGLFFAVILISGSRVATPSALALMIAFHAAQWRDARDAPPVHRASRKRILWASVAFATSLTVWQAAVWADPTVRRSLSGVLELAVRVVPPLSRFIEAEPFLHERIDESFRVRSEMNGAGVRAFLDYPVLGAGPGQVRDSLGREVHNTVLGVAAEMGTLGLVTLLPIAFLLVLPVLHSRDAFRRSQRGLVLGALLLPHGFHFLLRERWMWLFAIVFLAERYERAPDPAPDESKARL